MKIDITPIFPPIPARQWDYAASWSDRDEEDPSGFGATPEEAIQDLLELSDYEDGRQDCFLGIEAKERGEAYLKGYGDEYARQESLTGRQMQAEQAQYKKFVDDHGG